MAELYIFSQDDELLTIITESTGLISAPFRDEVNSVASEPFTFTVDADVERAKYVKEENRVVFKDKDGFFREMVIKELDDIDNIDGPQTTAICLPAWLDELSENFVLDKRYSDKEAQLALNDALAGTRYIGEVEVSLGLASTNFYRLSSVDCIWEIISVWGGEFKDTVEFTGNKITTRKILLLQRLGADKGTRFEIDHNIEQIQRTVLSYPKTAMYGWGASLETDGGGHTRYIDFADVEWKVSNGDPVDKPKGQKWVGDPDALLKYGRKHDGQLLHRFAEFSNQDYEDPEDPEELLWATWLNLQENKEPVINYKLSVDLLDKDASLGDGAVAIDREFARPIEIQTRVIAIEYDLLDIEGTAVVEMGQFLNLGDDDIYRELDDLKQEIQKPRPTKPIDNESFPDIKPGIPSNVMAVGGFQQIQIFWDYDSEVYISHYEVYGSQIKDFIPDSQHLLYRGRVSAFTHEIDTDETWYYRIRAVNRRGTAGDYSVRVNAASVRINTPDIMFGSVTADLLANQLDIAEKLSQNTIDSINAGPMQEIVRTQQEIEATENRLINQLNREIGDVNASIGSLLDRTQGIEGTITSINQEVDEIDGRLLTTINQLTNLDDIVSDHTLTLNLLPGQLNAKAEKSELLNYIDKQVYNNKMTTLDLSIDGLNTTVSNTQSTVNGLTGQMSDALSQIAAVDIKADGVITSVSEIRADLDGLEIGGRNLFLDSSFEKFEVGDTPYGVQSSGTICEVTDEKSYHGNKSLKLKTSSVGFKRINPFGIQELNWLYLEENTDYMFSFYVYITEEITRTLRVGVNSTDGGSSTYKDVIISELELNKWNRITVNLRPTATARYWFYLLGLASLSYIDAIQIEKGNQATDWTPAPEDTDARITSVEGSIQTLAGQVELKASQTSVNSLTGRMSAAEGTLSVLPGQINAKVDKDGVIAQINLSSEGLRIDGNKHHITGQTLIDNGVIGTLAVADGAIARAHLQNAIITDAHIESLNVSKVNAGTMHGDYITAGTLNVNRLRAGQMDTSIITIRGGSSIDYMSIDGSRLESRGRYNMRWHNQSKTIDASLYLSSGNFRVANWTDERSIFFTPFGLSTFADGYGDGTSSGMLEFFSEEFESNTHGITLASQLGIAGIKSFQNRVFIDAYASVNVESRQSPIYFRPYKDARVGNNVFSMTVANESSPSLTSGFLMYGSDVSGPASGLRFSKAESNPYVAVVNGVGARGGDATLDAGIVLANTIKSRDGSREVYWNGSGGGTLLYGNNPFIADGVRSSSSALYLGVDDEVRVTNGAGYNNGNTVIYRPIRATEFRTSSSIEYKTNISELKEGALSIINSLKVVEYDLKDDLANGIHDNRQVGFIAEHNREIATADLSSINLYKVTSLNTRGLQEVDTKVYNIDKRVDIHDLKIQYLEQRLEQEIEKNKRLELRVQQLEGVA